MSICIAISVFGAILNYSITAMASFLPIAFKNFPMQVLYGIPKEHNSINFFIAIVYNLHGRWRGAENIC